MSTASPTAPPSPSTTPPTTPGGRALRRPAPRGGLTATLVRLELRRLLRNRRTVIFSLVMPGVLFLLFGANAGMRAERVAGGNVSGYVMLSMAIYGAMLAATGAGAAVSVERAVGWSRQLRLTPLRPAAYVAVKMLLAMVLGAAAVVVTLAVGRAYGARLDGALWWQCGLLAWLCALVFAAFGLFMGYLLPSENVMQILGPVLALLSFAGGLFVPLDQMGHVFASVARFTPVYGVSVVARYPLVHEGSLSLGIANVAVWTAVFAAGAAWRLRRDTARI